MATGLWLDFTRNSMQRLGLMKLIVHLVPADRGIEGNLLVRKFFDALTTKVTIDITKHPDLCKSLIDKKLLSFRYRNLDRNTLEKIINNEPMIDSIITMIEIQDLYLSDYTLPSITGAITQDVQGEPLNLAIQIGLLRENNHTLLSLGSLLKYVSTDTIKCFKEYIPTLNPFFLSLADKVVLLYAVLSSDLEVITKVLHNAVKMRRFDRASIGDKIPYMLNEIIGDYNTKAITQTDRSRINRLREISKSVENMIGKPSGGTGRAREQFITPRLEHLVEFGFLEKVNKFGYEYISSNENVDIEKYLSLLERDHTNLNMFFFSLVNDLNNCNAHKIEDQLSINSAIKEHSEILRDTVGYSPIIETILLSNISLIKEGQYFEISDGIKALEEYQTQNTKKLRFMTDRNGKRSYFKFMEK